MHGQRSPATRVDEPGEGQTPTTPPAARAPLLIRGGEIRRGFRPRPPRPLRGHPSSREEGKRDHPAAFGGTPPHTRRGDQESPSITRTRAPLSAWRSAPRSPASP